MKRSTALNFALIALSSAAGFFAIACDKKADGEVASTRPATQAVSITVGPVTHEPIARTVAFTGTLFGDEESQIASKVTGRIVAVKADLGDRVDDGAILAEVDPTDYQLYVQQKELALQEALSKLGLAELPADTFDLTTIATVRRASVQAENAKARLDRAKQLYEQTPPLISPQEFADTQTQYEVAKQDYDVALLDAKSSLAIAKSRQAEIAVAKQQLADTKIRAPRPNEAIAPGRWAVAERQTSVGEYVQAGTVVFRVIADQPIKLRTSIPERYLADVKQDQDVTLYTDAQSAPVSGKVTRVSPAVDVQSRTFSVEVTFQNADHLLRAGTFGRGTITVGTRTDVTTVPPAALYSFAGIDRVFTMKDGKAVANAVDVVLRDDKRVVVAGNLGGATEAATSGLARLANGVPVQVKR